MVVLSLEVLHSSRRATLAYAMPATLIPAVTLLATGEPTRIALAVLLAVFLALILYGFRRRHRAYETAIVTRLQNDMLLDELAATERSLRASIEEERLILEAALVGIAIVKNDRFVRCNRRMEQIFGFHRNGLNGVRRPVRSKRISPVPAPIPRSVRSTAGARASGAGIAGRSSIARMRSKDRSGCSRI
jgi:PAS domain-containing protein